MSKTKQAKKPTFAKILSSLEEKRPAAINIPPAGKHPVAEARVSFNDEYPSWRIGRLELAIHSAGTT